MSDLCRHCLQPLAWFARAGLWVHEETMVMHCDPDRAASMTAAPSELHGVKPTVDTARPVSIPWGGYPRWMSG